MKIVARYLTAVYMGVSFLSFYSYLADIVFHNSPLTIQLQHLISYLVYFIMYKIWVFGLILPVYFFMFYKCGSGEKILYKLAFILVLSVCLASIFTRRDLYFGEPPKGFRLFAIYFMTGLSLFFIEMIFWRRRSRDIIK